MSRVAFASGALQTSGSLARLLYIVAVVLSRKGVRLPFSIAAGRSVLHQSVSHVSRPERHSSIALAQRVRHLWFSGTVPACELGKAGLWRGGALGLLLWDAIDPYKGGSIGTISDFEIGGVPIGFTSFTEIARPSPFRAVATHQR